LVSYQQWIFSDRLLQDRESSQTTFIADTLMLKNVSFLIIQRKRLFRVYWSYRTSGHTVTEYTKVKLSL
jgi:hypothetical protein